ncbi:uncharacterized protein BKCO1_1500027 [Diplodia corticola]|uniref:Uncharacterized protein n=1 Tax=Diplodia corticola TaxID=236234 RepID=A0A1J9R592_9PEZI|nr:uncharacterized protein BKCO1_1500027 [Diplodia corticola]OJD35721.1 hypothetical protein BKCO1_1500027 [Diplodia corticola]
MGSDFASGVGIALRGAPDEYIGEKQMPSSSRRAMQVEMTQDVIDDMLQSIRDGRPPMLHFSQNPILKIGETKIVIDATKETFRNELYQTAPTNAEDGSSDVTSNFFGTVDYRLALQRASEASQAMNRTDSALQALKSNMKAIRKEKEAPKWAPKIISTARLNMLTSKRKRVSMEVDPLQLDRMKRLQQGRYAKPSRGTVLGGRLVASTSNASSPALSAASPRPTAPTSAPISKKTSAVESALRKALVHILALEPVKVQDIARKMRVPKEDISSVLEKIAKEQGGEWKLTDKAYKELDPFSPSIRFWTEEQRKKAIDNAIKALDRQRLDPRDKIWQNLLPEHERGKGKILSKLSLASSSAAPKTSTPSVKPAMGNKQKLNQLTKKTKTETKKKEPKKKKSEEDAFGIASQKKSRPLVGESTTALGQKKTLKGEEKGTTTLKRKIDKPSSEEDTGRTTLSKAVKRPIAEDQANQNPPKKTKRSNPDDGEVGQVARKTLSKMSGEGDKGGQNTGLQKTTRIRKEGTTVVSAKLNKENAQSETKVGSKPITKKQTQTNSTVRTTNTAPTVAAPKKPTSKMNEQKASEHTAEKSIQPKINGLPFTSTKKVANALSSKNPSSTGSPLNTSDVEKSRTVHKSSTTAAGVTTPGNSDRTLKRKANDIDSDIHKHDVSVKHRKTAGHAPVPGNTATATPPSSDRPSLKRKPDGTMADSKQPTAKKLAATYKASKPTQTPTPSYSGASSISSTSSTHSHQLGMGHVHHHDSPQSFHDASSASPEQGLPLNHRRAIELSAQFKRCYPQYLALYMSLKGRPATKQELEELYKKDAILKGMKKEVNRLWANPEA